MGSSYQKDRDQNQIRREVKAKQKRGRKERKQEFGPSPVSLQDMAVAQRQRANAQEEIRRQREEEKEKLQQLIEERDQRFIELWKSFEDNPKAGLVVTQEQENNWQELGSPFRDSLVARLKNRYVGSKKYRWTTPPMGSVFLLLPIELIHR